MIYAYPVFGAPSHSFCLLVLGSMSVLFGIYSLNDASTSV
jgi:hypothetical protein